MSLLGPAIAVLLLAAPSVAVIKRVGGVVPDESSQAVLLTLSDGLEKLSLIPSVVALSCDGELPCLAKLAREAGASAAIGVTVLRGSQKLSIDLEATDLTGHRLAVATFGVPLSGKPFPPEAAAFLRKVKQAIAEDAPFPTRLIPADEPPPPEVVRVETSHRLIQFSVITTLAATAVGIAFAIGGAVIKGNLQGQLTSLTRTEANRQAGLANGLGTGSVVCFGIAGAAAITTGILWFQRPDPEQE